MKKLLLNIIVAVAILMAGCTKEESFATKQDGEMVLVNLVLGGEICVEETPLTKTISSDDLIGIQVYKQVNQNEQAYAFGLFDDVSKMSLYLHSGETYKFVSTVVKRGKQIVANLPGDGTRYWAPFAYGSGYGIPTVLENKFVYTQAHRYIGLDEGSIRLEDGGYDYYPNADRFYGEISGYNAANAGAVTIPLKRVSFGLTLAVSGITDGNVSVTIKNSTKTFVNNTNITEDTQFGMTTWSFYDLKSAWQYADNYTENFTVSVVWNRGVGVTQDLGSKSVQFKRNVVNHVKIKLSSPTKTSGIAVSLEEPEIVTEMYTFGN